MKKVYIFQKREDSDIYSGYYGDDIPPMGSEYERDYGAPLQLISMVLYGAGSIIPAIIFYSNRGDLNFTTETLAPMMLDQNVIRLHADDDRSKYVDIALENLKEIWEKFIDLREQKVKKIIITREENHFSVSEF